MGCDLGAWHGRAMRTRPALPVVVLSGKLGCGKTTLLNHILAQSHGRVGVIVNDFGDINVDAFLIQGQVDAKATFSGGCLCCLADPGDLDRALADLAAPSLDLDVILIEASGLAEPRELARMVLSSSVSTVRFGGVVEILDAADWATPEVGSPDPAPVAIDHLRVASLLVINKSDQIAQDAGARERLDAVVAAHAPTTPVVHTMFGRVDPELLFDPGEHEEPTGQLSFADFLAEQRHGERGHDHHDHGHAGFSSVSVDSSMPVDPTRLIHFLENRSAGAYRVKGRVHMSRRGHRDYTVQAVGDWFGFERFRVPEGQESRTQLVVIGPGLAQEGVRREVESALRGCLSDGRVCQGAELHRFDRFTR